jgi:FMN reductase
MFDTAPPCPHNIFGMRYLIISCSRSPSSRSRALAKVTFAHLTRMTRSGEFIDVAKLDLPLCDADTCYGVPAVQEISRKIKVARGIIVATPIYNYDVNAVAKNLLELTGQAWVNKVVGLICAAGGHGSYMSVMPFANSLMLDFRCFILPRFVYAPKSTADDEFFGDTAINQRADELAADLVRVTEALFPEAA